MRKWATMGMVAALLAGAATVWAGGGVPVSEASEAQIEQAREPYVRARKAYDSGDFATAAEGFRASYEIVASPNSLLMRAKSLESLGRLAEAYRTAKEAVPLAEAAAAEDRKYGRTAKDARMLMEELRGRVGFLTVRLPLGESGPVTVGGRSVPPEALGEPILVDPGEVIVTFTGPEGLVEERITLGSGGTALVDFGQIAQDQSPPPDPLDDGGFQIGVPRAVGLGLAGAGVAGMVVFGVFGAMTSSKFSSLEDSCTPPGSCPPDAQGDIDDGKTYQTVANVGLAVGITGLVAGAALFVLEPQILGEGDEETASLRLTVGPTALGLRGTF